MAAVVAFVLRVSCCFRQTLRFASDIREVVSLIDTDSAPHHPHRELSLSLAALLDGNSARISVMRWIFRASAVAVLAETVLWIAYLAAD